MQCNEYEIIEKAIKYIEKNYYYQPDLNDIAEHAGLSEFHFQRIFTKWAGVSPKKFLQYVTLKHAKESLMLSRNLLDTAYDVGLSAPSRLYDLFVTFEAVTPGTYKNMGEGLNINYSITDTPFGRALLAFTDKGITDLNFIIEDEEIHIQKLFKRWNKASFIEAKNQSELIIQKIFKSKTRKSELKLYIKGTNFQIKVWQALLNIPEGFLLSYKDISEIINKPSAMRAVGTAIGKNPVHYLIPCHRVLRQDGQIGGYAGGTYRKRAILAMEKACSEHFSMQETNMTT